MRQRVGAFDQSRDPRLRPSVPPLSSGVRMTRIARRENGARLWRLRLVDDEESAVKEEEKEEDEVVSVSVCHHLQRNSPR